MTDSTSKAGKVAEEVDLKEMISVLWKKKTQIVLSGVCALFLAFGYAFFIAKPVYESSALLLPTQEQNPDQLSGAAALLGKKINAGNADVDLYQSLLTSRTVIGKLLRTPMSNKYDSAKGRVEPLATILGIDTSNPISMENAAKDLSKAIIVNSKESGEGGILVIQFYAQSPWLAQAMGQFVLEIGQEQLRVIRIERADVTLPRLGFAVAEAKAEWEAAAKSVAAFKSRNRSIILPEQMLDLSRLQTEQQVKEQKYLLARKEYESESLMKAKAVPPMMILDPANLPAQKIKPKRGLILALGFFVGLALSSLSVLLWNILLETKE